MRPEICLPPQWRGPLLRLMLAWAALLLLLRGEWAAMAAQWWHSSTYNHILLIPPIIGWLVHMRLPVVAQMDPRAWWPGLIALAAALFLWLLGSLAGVNLASQLAAVLALQAAVLTLLGPRIFAALLFPLGYMLFLVPFGDELVPSLQMITARLTIALTEWSGVPAAIEGVFIDTPAGLFEVAEACSGVKFLIAMVALGTLVAQLCFRSWRRRALFMALAIAMPIAANGVRAWGTIYIAQFQGVEFAAGFDHIFYGWIFFGVVMAAVLAIGWRYFDRDWHGPAVDVARIDRLPLPIRGHMAGGAALAAVAALTLGAAAWNHHASALAAPLPPRIALPHVPGWHRVDHRPAVWWEPRASGANHRLLGTYADGAGHRVEVFYALYAAEAQGREASGFGEGALVPDSDWRWLGSGMNMAGGRAEWLQARGVHRRLAITFYRNGGLLTGSGTRLKLATMHNRLRLRPAPVAMLILSAEGRDAQAAIAAFVEATGPVGKWMDRIGQLP